MEALALVNSSLLEKNIYLSGATHFQWSDVFYCQDTTLMQWKATRLHVWKVKVRLSLL